MQYEELKELSEDLTDILVDFNNSPDYSNEQKELINTQAIPLQAKIKNLDNALVDFINEATIITNKVENV
jgi:hypothetical protein